jgi:hypothetical protein
VTVVLLGNTNPMDPRVGGSAVTRFVIPDDVGADEAIRTVTDVWKGYHSADAPAWVESDDSSLASRLAGYWGAVTPRPDGWTGLGDYLTVEEPDTAPPISPSEQPSQAVAGSDQPQLATPVQQATPTEETA